MPIMHYLQGRCSKGLQNQRRTGGVEVTATAADGSALYDPGGKLVKTKIRMRDGLLASDEAQSLYFPQDHKDARLFKEMAVILCERGFVEESKLRAECKGFKCLPGATTCCCHHILFNQLDFVAVESLLKITCKLWGVKVLFLPKFHCELNFIKQCWGYAKRIYCELPVLSKEAELEKNVIAALDSVPLKSMRRYAWRSWWFMMFYGWGLDRKLAAWASKKYWGHHVITEALMETIDREAPK
ncbi:hypothetical protein BDN71DRAFT_1427169 [Pleurotus eryngii]|uniref:Uncharacterized protein n=1 Tax=Pleurotus eryngii TaxID=5323 RepID=A0A9P6A6B0_PLEER|nr:hypothetical protein BDN71DRAFT_1427169 [Pleurotus eryngii]